MQTTLILVTILMIGIVVGNKTEKGCGNNPADIVFVLDESGSIWGPDFTRQLEFVHSTIASFDVGFNRTHIGVLTFETNNRVIFHLGEYTDEGQLMQVVKEIKQKRGETYTHLALKRLREEMFSPQYARSWVRHVAIVITDGESHYPEKTKEEARLCHEAGFQMFAIGVGQKVVQRELYAIASAPDLVFKVDNYAALDSLRQILAWKACEPPTTLPTPTTTGAQQPPPTTTGAQQPPPTTTGAQKPPPTTTTRAQQPPPTTTGAQQPEPTTTGAQQPPPTTTGAQQPPPTTTGAQQPPPTTTTTKPTTQLIEGEH